MKGTLGKVVAGITVVVATAIGSMGALPAHAGSNGQELEIYDPYPNISSICIVGYNQYDQLTEQCIAFDYGSYVEDIGWWWKGQVNLYFFNTDGQYAGSQSTYVPGYQSNSDFSLVIVQE